MSLPIPPPICTDCRVVCVEITSTPDYRSGIVIQYQQCPKCGWLPPTNEDT